jgi:prepilin-type N-terminal cleavage/methylation domain-containing protein/prepilin-type processing-associated H-X9-DG protein
MRPGRQTESGFTLIELLVVISIIAILAAILFPIFAQAREKARQAACLSNLKQIGAATMLYLQDYDETFPGGKLPIPFGWNLFVPGPTGTWENMTIKRFGNVALTSVAARLQPYAKNAEVFLDPNDPRGERFANYFAEKWDPQITRASYAWPNGLSLGWSRPGFPKGTLNDPGVPLRLAEITRPALLQMAEDAGYYHARNEPGEARKNICYADGHAKFSRAVDAWVKPEQQPWVWNLYNPRQPVNVEQPCSPTCAEQSLRD